MYLFSGNCTAVCAIDSDRLDVNVPYEHAYMYAYGPDIRETSTTRRTESLLSGVSTESDGGGVCAFGGL